MPSRAPRRSPSRSSGLGRARARVERRGAQKLGRRALFRSVARITVPCRWSAGIETKICSPREIVGRSSPVRRAVPVTSGQILDPGSTIEGSRRPCSLPLRLSSPNAPTPSRGTARSSRDLPTGRRDGPSRRRRARAHLLAGAHERVAGVQVRASASRRHRVFSPHLCHLDVSMPPASLCHLPD